MGFYRGPATLASNPRQPPGAWGGQPPPFRLAHVLANPSPHSLLGITSELVMILVLLLLLPSPPGTLTPFSCALSVGVVYLGQRNKGV